MRASAVLDASALLALLQGEPGSDRVLETLPGALVCSVNLSEVVAKLAGHDMPEADIRKELFEPMTTDVNSQGNDVNLDVEVGEMVKNGARYKMYVRLLRKMYRQMEMAITGRQV